jgi:predicted nucleic acid-binding protein
MIVLDTNIVISGYLEDDIDLSLLTQDELVLAPDIFELELLNVLRKYHGRRSLDLHTVDELHQLSMSLIDELIPASDFTDTIRQISFALNQPIYDCAFLALAKIRYARFVSFDKKLLARAKSLNICTIDGNDFLKS